MRDMQRILPFFSEPGYPASGTDLHQGKWGCQSSLRLMLCGCHDPSYSRVLRPVSVGPHRHGSARWVVEGLRGRGDEVELIDAKAVGLPMLDRTYKEYPKGHAPERLEQLRANSGRRLFGLHHREYNRHPVGLKNLTDHFLKNGSGGPPPSLSYSAGRVAGARAATAWHGTLSGDGHGGDFEHDRGGADCADTSLERARRSARAARRSRMRFRDLPTISPGGSRPPRRSGRESRRRIEERSANPRHARPWLQQPKVAGVAFCRDRLRGLSADFQPFSPRGRHNDGIGGRCGRRG